MSSSSTAYAEKTQDSVNLKSRLKNIMEDLESNPERINDLSVEEVRQLRKEIHPYSHIIGLSEKHTVLTFTNMEAKFQKHAMGIGMAGFIFKMLEEFDQDDHPQMDGIEQPNMWKEYTAGFLKTMFGYNPEDHVRPLKTAQAGKLTDLSKNQLKVLNIPAPPADTFHRFERYYVNHFEQIRDLTANLTGFEPTMEDAIQVLETFDTAAEAHKFKDKYQDDFTSQVIIVQNGAWSLTGPWAQNREKMEYLNENTQFLGNVMKRLEADEKLGADMMQKRVAKKKKRNVERQGPDPKSLKSYVKSTGKKMEKLGAERVQLNKSDLDDATKKYITSRKGEKMDLNEIRHINDELDTNPEPSDFVQYQHADDGSDDDDSCPDDAVEVGVINISEGGKKVTMGKMYTEADHPEDIQKQADAIQKERAHPGQPMDMERRAPTDKKPKAQTRRGKLLAARNRKLAEDEEVTSSSSITAKSRGGKKLGGKK